MSHTHRLGAAALLVLAAVSGCIAPHASTDVAHIPSELGSSVVMDDTDSASGTPIYGTPDAENAPLMEPGQYSDVSVSSSSGEVTKYYRVKRTWPGSTLRVSSIGRMPQTDAWNTYKQANWTFNLVTADAQETTCASSTASVRTDSNTGILAGATLVALPVDPRVAKPETHAQACGDAQEFIFSVTRSAGIGGEIPVELRVIEEPPIANALELPPGISEVPKNNSGQLTSPASGTPRAVTGGTNFNDAVEITSGTYTTEILPGEMRFFRTKIDFGQSGVFAVDKVNLSPEALSESLVPNSFHVTSNVYAPDFSRMDSEESNSYESYQTSEKQVKPFTKGFERNQVPDVRYRNRWDSPAMYYDTSRGFSMGGYYYYVIALGNEPFMGGKPGQVDFSVAVSGTVSGEPQPSVDPSSSVSPATLGPVPESAGEHGSNHPIATVAGVPRWIWMVTGGTLMACGGVGLVVGLLRRRRG